MRLRKFLEILAFAIAATAAVTAFSPTFAQGAKKPNILVIWGDDIGGFNISAYNQGVMGYKTPNIDSIGKQGAMFTGTVSRAAPRVARLSSQVNRRFVRA